MSLVKECNTSIVTAALPYHTSPVCTRVVDREETESLDLLRPSCSDNCVFARYIFSGVQVYACICTQCIRSHDILCVLYLVLIYSDIDFK